MAFTARDKEKDSVPMAVNQPGRFAVPCTSPGPSTANSPTSVKDVAKVDSRS